MRKLRLGVLTRLGAAAVVLAVATGVVVAIAWSREDGGESPAAAAPSVSRWINPETGAFWNGDGPWDNRTLSDEAKRAEPWYDPRWKPFSDCMVARGYDVRASSSRPFAQEDLDRVIDQANVERAGMDNRTLKPGEDPGGIAGAFLACANRWLTIAPDDYAANGIRWLEPGDVPEP